MTPASASPQLQPARRVRVARRLRAALRQVRAAMRSLRWPLLLIAALLALGTAVFFVGGSQPTPARALVYTLNLVTFSLQPSDVPDNVWLQLLSFGIIVGGVIGVAGGAAKVVDYLTDEQEQQIALAGTYRDHVIVCGIGSVGYRVVNELLQFGESVVAVNSDAREEWVDALRRSGVPVVVGDARKRQTLLNAGAARASAMVCCTSDELTNLDMALDARDINPGVKIVLRMFDQALAQKVSKGFNIKTAFSVSALAAPAFAVAATRTNVDHSFRVRGELMNVSTVSVREGCALVGRTVLQVEEAFNVSAVSRVDGSAWVMHPHHDTVLRPGDVYVFAGQLAGIKALNAAA